MMRVGRARRDAQLLMWVGTAFLFVVACNTNFPQLPAVRMYGPAGQPMGHPALVNEADSNYTYDSARSAIAVDTSSGLRNSYGTLPTITIATAHISDTLGRENSSRIIARLHSNGAYPVMGILDSGYHYVWRDSGGLGSQPWRLLIVPKRLDRQMTWLKRDTTVATYVAGAATEPRLAVSPLAYGMCSNNCGSGHCASKDSLRVFLAPADDLTIRIKKGT